MSHCYIKCILLHCRCTHTSFITYCSTSATYYTERVKRAEFIKYDQTVCESPNIRYITSVNKWSSVHHQTKIQFTRRISL